MQRMARHAVQGGAVLRALAWVGLPFVAWVALAHSAAQASTLLIIDEFQWDEANGVASVSGHFTVNSYTGEQWRLTAIEITVSGTVYSTSLFPYPEFSSLPFTHAFDEVEISPSIPLVAGADYLVGIKKQRYFSWMPGNGWDSGTVFRQSVTAEAVPEPSTAFLLGCGLIGLVAHRRLA